MRNLHLKLKIVGGNPEWKESDIESIKSFCSGKSEINVTFYPRRSLDQNKIHKVYMRQMGDYFGHSKEQMEAMMEVKFLEGEPCEDLPPRLFNKFIEQYKDWAGRLGLYLEDDKDERFLEESDN